MNELYHHGILGQKWGIRRYQNPDGTLTEAGRARYSSGSERKKFTRLASTLSADSREKLKKSPQTKAAAASVGVRNAAEKCKALDSQMDKIREDFYNNEQLYEKYLQKAVDVAMKACPGETRKDLYDFIKYEDGAQGECDPFYQYGKDNPKVWEKSKQLVRQYEEAYKDLIKESKKATEAFLTDIADAPVRTYDGFALSSSIRDRVAEIVANEAKGRYHGF